jgi:hypothetical protein
MPEQKIGKRALKKMTKSSIAQAFMDAGLNQGDEVHIEDATAGSVKYQNVKFLREQNQVVAAIYGSINHCASIWLKEDAFAEVRAHLPDDAVVEDVAPFRRGFQWSIHIKSPSDELIGVIAEKSVYSAKVRLEKTLARRQEDADREVRKAERAKVKAETRRNWKEL